MSSESVKSNQPINSHRRERNWTILESSKDSAHNSSSNSINCGTQNCTNTRFEWNEIEKKNAKIYVFCPDRETIASSFKN